MGRFLKDFRELCQEYFWWHAQMLLPVDLPLCYIAPLLLLRSFFSWTLPPLASSVCCPLLLLLCLLGIFFYSLTTLPPSSLKSRDEVDSYFSGHTQKTEEKNKLSLNSVDTRFTEPYRPSKPLRQVTHRTAKIKPTDGRK